MSVRDWHAEREGWRVGAWGWKGNPTAWINEKFEGDLATHRVVSMTHPCLETVDAATARMPNGLCFRIEYQPSVQPWQGFFWSPIGGIPYVPLTLVRAGDEVELRYLMAKMAIELMEGR